MRRARPSHILGLMDATAHDFNARLAGARRGSRDAWESLYRQYSPDLLAYLRNQRIPNDEDVLGEVWLQIVRDLHTFSGDDKKFRSWALRIAHNRIVDQHRVHQRRRRISERSAEWLGGTEGLQVDEDDAVLAIESIERLEEIFLGLSDGHRSVLFLRFVLELSHRDIGIILNCSVPAVKMLQMRAIRAAEAALSATSSNGSVR